MIKKFFKIISIAMILCVNVSAYFFDGKSLTLVDCSYDRFGYDYGYVGIYKDGYGNLYKIFFGSNYCEH